MLSYVNLKKGMSKNYSDTPFSIYRYFEDTPVISNTTDTDSSILPFV